MRAPEELNQLAARILERRQNNAAPYTLFLGEGVAQAAGLPGKQDIALQIFFDPSLAEKFIGPDAAKVMELISQAQREGADVDDDQLDAASERLMQGFELFLDQMSPSSQQRMLQSYYASKPVPAFYQSLALLVKAGFFNHILTTNIDTLLEQALVSTGLQAGRDFRMVNVGQKMDSYAQNTLSMQFEGYDNIRSKTSSQTNVYVGDLSQAPAAVLVVKLHGDIASRHVAYSMDSIIEALNSQRNFLRSEFVGDMIFVGYRFESEPINHWLDWVPGEFWWVSPDYPDNDLFTALESKRPVSLVGGPSARPEQFFSYLANQLLSQAVTFSPDYDTEDPSAPSATLAPELPEDEYLRAELERNKALLISLVQSASPGDRSGQVQLDYQRRLVADLEDQLRSLESSQERLLHLMTRLRSACKDVGIDPNAAAFVNSQLKMMKKEYMRETPNQSIVSAAVGASVLMAERLGGDLIDPALIEELASFAPSAWGRRL